VRFTSITIMQSLLDSPRPAPHLCSVMQQERSTYRVHLSTLVSESSSVAESIIGLRPHPCSMSAYHAQIGYFLLERPLPIFHQQKSALVIILIPPWYTNCTTIKPPPKGCFALAHNRPQQSYFITMWEDQPRDDRGSGLWVVGTMRSVWTTGGYFASDLHMCAKMSFPCRCRRHFSQRKAPTSTKQRL
jgi:hypothetical protein